MTDWAKIAAGIKIEAGETPESVVRDQEAQRSAMPSSARLEGLLEHMQAVGRLIGPEQIKNILHVKDLGKIEPYPNGLEAALLSESLITPGNKVFEDHRLFYMPESFDGVANSVINFITLVQAAEVDRQKSKPDAKSIFYQNNDTSYKYETEAWAKSAPTKGVWVLTPDTVPKDTRHEEFESQSTIIEDNYKNYTRGSAQENIMLLSLTGLHTYERLYSCTWGWTSTAVPGPLVAVGRFDADGFEVISDHPDCSCGETGAFLRWNFSSNS